MLETQLPTRERVSLAGAWRFVTDPARMGRRRAWHSRGLPDHAVLAPVPGIWNDVEPGYSGVCYYEYGFDAAQAWPSRAARLAFGGCNYRTEAWLNGTALGVHEGGYTPFAFDCSYALRPEANRLVLRVTDPPPRGEVDGLALRRVPSAKESWYGGFGGPWGGVWVDLLPRVWIEDVFAAPRLDLSQARVSVELRKGTTETTRARVVVTLTDPRGMVVGIDRRSVRLREEVSTAAFQFELNRVVPWSPVRPVLYGWRVEIESDTGDRDTASGTFGMRSCDWVDGELVLNGEPIEVRGVLLQPVYPGNSPIPSGARSPDAEVAAILDAGFNLVRSHLRPPYPGFLAAADRGGLLVYEEPPLAWIEPSGRLLEHGRREVEEMIRRDRNHPSVVTWGLFNENARAAVACGAALAGHARALDPTRPIIDDSGGAAIGEAGMFSWRGRTRCWPARSRRALPLNDLHVYLGAPPRQAVRELFAALGPMRRIDLTFAYDPAVPDVATGRGKVLVSEVGCGGWPDLDADLAEFDGQLNSPDATGLIGLRSSLADGLRDRGLDAAFGGVAGITRRSQEMQARSLENTIRLLRANANVSGYVITQFAEAGWEVMAALTDLWGRPRPALEAVRRVQRGRRPRARDASRRERAPMDDPWGAAEQSSGLLLIRPGQTRWPDAVAAARSGTRVLVVGLDRASAPALGDALGLPIAAGSARGNFMGVFHYAHPRGPFAGAEAVRLLDEADVELIGPWAVDEMPGAEVLAGCFSVADGASEVTWRATLQRLAVGAGSVTICQLGADPQAYGSSTVRDFCRRLVGWLSAG
ncbi:MAG: glycoside hydrolase family 2 TIM barrel-domain containing protein [Chloroflexota bacterium]